MGAANLACGGAAQKLKRTLMPTLPGCLALGGVAVCTWVSFRLGQTFAFTGFLYLVFVVLAFGRRP